MSSLRETRQWSESGGAGRHARDRRRVDGDSSGGIVVSRSSGTARDGRVPIGAGNWYQHGTIAYRYGEKWTYMVSDGTASRVVVATGPAVKVVVSDGPALT
jgi:hypothetical protein